MTRVAPVDEVTDHRRARREYARFLEERGHAPLLSAREFDAPGWANPPARLFSLLEMAVDNRLLRGTDDDGVADVHLFDMIAEAEREGCKSFAFGRELTEALWNTSPPDVKVADVPMPMPTVFACLPMGNGSGLRYAIVTTMQGSNDPRLDNTRALIRERRGVDLKIVARHERIDPLYRVIVVTEDWRMVRFQGDLNMPLSRPMHDENTLADLTIDDEDQRLCGFAWTLVAAISARPELIVSGSTTRVAKKNNGVRHHVTVVRPAIVGEKYLIQREKGSGTHASPRSHWRRGHFRNQACGPKKQLHKLIWIEPMLIVGGGNAAV